MADFRTFSRPDRRRVHPEQRKVHEPTHLWDLHHEILRRITLGQKNVDIAKALNCSAVTVSNIRNSQLGQERLGELHRQRDLATVDVARSIREAAPKAFQLVLESIDNEELDMRERLRQANSLLDRAGYAPVRQVSTQMTSLSLTGSDIEALKARAIQAALEDGNILDVTPSEE